MGSIIAIFVKLSKYCVPCKILHNTADHKSSLQQPASSPYFACKVISGPLGIKGMMLHVLVPDGVRQKRLMLDLS